MQTSLHLLLADAILVLHFAFVGFIIAGFVLVWLGYFLRWGFIRNARFRLSHLFAMGFVAAEGLVGAVCPLTTWENALRARVGEGSVYQQSFVQHWLGKILFYEASEQTFTLIYCAFFVLLVVTYLVVPPHANRRKVGPS